MTAAEIAEVLSMALSTVSAVLRRVGLGKRSRLEPPEPPHRYERGRAGELVHLDIKKLGRISGAGKRITGRRVYSGHRGRKARGELGWEFVHVAVDDATRLAYAEVLPNEQRRRRRPGSCAAPSPGSPRIGVAVELVMSDNGACYRSHALARDPAASSASAGTSSRAPTAHAPTAKPSASSRRSPTAGPTARSTPAPKNAAEPSPAG